MKEDDISEGLSGPRLLFLGLSLLYLLVGGAANIVSWGRPSGYIATATSEVEMLRAWTRQTEPSGVNLGIQTLGDRMLNR